MKHVVYTLCIGLLLLATPAWAVKTNLSSAFSKGTTATETLPLDTTIAMAASTEQWLAVVTLRATNTTSAIVTINVTLKESLTAVPDITAQLSLKPGTTTVQIPNQYFAADFALGSHTFQVRVNQDTNSPVTYQVESSLELVNNTGYGGVPIGGGDISGPGAAVTDHSLVCWDGTLGDTIKECGAWGVVAGSLASLTGSVGIGDLTPDERLDVECSGAITSSGACAHLTDTRTSATASVAKIGQTLTIGGANSGSGSQSVGTLCDVSGGTTNQCLYVSGGDIVFVNSTSKIANQNDLTPDAFIDFASSGSDAANLLLLTAAGTSSVPHQAAVIANQKTGGNSGEFKSGLQITSSGVWAGINTALLVNATDGVQDNIGIAVLAGKISVVNGNIETQAGDLSTASGKITATQTAGGAGIEATCNRPSVDGCIHVTTNGGGSGDAVGLEYTVSNANATATAVEATVTGQDVIAMQLTVSGESDGIAEGMRITVDGNGAPIAVGLTIDVVDTADPEALRTISGGVFFGAGGDEGFAYQNTSKQLLLWTGNSNPTTDASLEVHGDDGDIAIQAIATGSAGAGSGTTFSASATGAVTEASIGAAISNGQTSSTAAINRSGLDVSATGTWDGAGSINAAVRGSASGGLLNYAFWALQGGTRIAGVDDKDFQSETCAAGGGACALTLTPSAGNVSVTCEDVDSCDVTLTETDQISGRCLNIVCENDGAGAGKTCDFADTAGVMELSGNLTLDQWDTAVLCYRTDRWVQFATTNN